MKKITEQESLYRNLESKSTLELLNDINTEDQKVALAVEQSIPQIMSLVDVIYDKMSKGGRLIYIGAGTSGRLGIVDASECPPTFGVPHNWVIGIIAGGDGAIRKAVEFAEDNIALAWEDLEKHAVNDMDVVIGIAASGTTPYVVKGLADCNKNGIVTGCITCNINSPLAQEAKFPIEVNVGPEYITGSTRMKSGTAQKLILNMISTSVMIKLGRIKDNKMVDMQLSNNKLVDRGTKIIMNKSSLDYEEAQTILLTEGSVRKALKKIREQI